MPKGPVHNRVTLLGPNGAGKSTLIKAATGLIVPERGQVRIAGRRPHTSRGAAVAGRHPAGDSPAHAPAGMAVLLTTHLIEEAGGVADRVIVIAEGRIVADTPPAEPGRQRPPNPSRRHRDL